MLQSVYSCSALEDITLPLSQPIRDINGRMINEIALEKGTTVMLGIHGYNRRKSLWGEDATEWKPERWLSPLPESIRNVQSGAVYSNMSVFVHTTCMGYR